jgi:hypothetical protein
MNLSESQSPTAVCWRILLDCMSTTGCFLHPRLAPCEVLVMYAIGRFSERVASNLDEMGHTVVSTLK